MKSDVLRKLQAARTAFLPVALLTRLSDGNQCLVINGVPSGDLTPDPSVLEDIQQRIRTDNSGCIEGGIFARVYNVPLRLVLVGAVHIAQALAPMARCAGFRVTIIDPRTVFATVERFPDVELNAEWPDAALHRLGIDARTALVTLTHEPKLDDPALLAAIRSDAFYIGALGSSRTHTQRITRLRQAGATEPELARIHAPVGFPLGGRRPAEVAVSIIAEIISVHHAGATG
jgi:xanthine dehydrogenase accessory factor